MALCLGKIWEPCHHGKKERMDLEDNWQSLPQMRFRACTLGQGANPPLTLKPHEVLQTLVALPAHPRGQQSGGMGPSVVSTQPCTLLIASSFKVVLVSPDIVLLSFLFYLLASLFFAAPSPDRPTVDVPPAPLLTQGDGSSAPRHPSVTRSPLSRLLVLPMQHGQSEFDLPFSPKPLPLPSFPASGRSWKQ